MPGKYDPNARAALAALAALEAHPFLDDTTASWVRLNRHDALAARNALRALVAWVEAEEEVRGAERLTAPPTDDEREALAALVAGVVPDVWALWCEEGLPPGVYRLRDEARATADAILASDVWRNRRPGPIADAQVDAAAKTLIQAEPSEPWPDASTWGGIVAYGAAVGGIDELRDFARVALEAAASVEGDAS